MSKTTAEELLFKVMASSTVKFNFCKGKSVSLIHNKATLRASYSFFTALQAFKTGSSFINGILEFVHSLMFWPFFLFLSYYL